MKCDAGCQGSFGRRAARLRLGTRANRVDELSERRAGCQGGHRGGSEKPPKLNKLTSYVPDKEDLHRKQQALRTSRVSWTAATVPGVKLKNKQSQIGPKSIHKQIQALPHCSNVIPSH
ncbi:hypothetical protein Q8A73_004203 [Channa argus]|nr:hypothetical protein Q8A73_004203 [Channa argus]